MAHEGRKAAAPQPWQPVNSGRRACELDNKWFQRSLSVPGLMGGTRVVGFLSDCGWSQVVRVRDTCQQVGWVSVPRRMEQSGSASVGRLEQITMEPGTEGLLSSCAL